MRTEPPAGLGPVNRRQFLRVLGLSGAAASSWLWKRWSSASSAQATAAFAAAPTAAGDKTLRFVWIGDLTPIWHPAGYQTFGQAVVFSLIFNNLVKLSPDMKTLVPDLAEKWEVSPDATQFTFRLRKGVKWHDGTPFTANDVVFSFSRQVVEKYRYVKFMTAVEGAEDYAAGKAKDLAGIRAPDDYTVKISLGAPDGLFLTNLTEPGNVIVPQHVLQDANPSTIETAAFSTKSPIGTGPYKFVRYETDQYVEFDANPEYVKGTPRIGKAFMKRLTEPVTVAQLESGEVDLGLRLDPKEYDHLVKVPTLNIVSRPGVGMTSLGFAGEQPRVHDRRVRQAIYYAIDRPSIVKAVFEGRAKVLKGAPPSMDGYAGLNPYAYNRSKAKQLLQEAKFDMDAPFRIIYDQTYPAVPQYLPIVAQMLQDLGLKVELNPSDSTAYIARFMNQRDTYEIAVSQGGSYGLGPWVTATYFNCKRPGWEYGYLNCDFDNLFVDATKVADPKQRDAFYAKAAKIFNEDLPLLPLWTPNDLHASTKKLRGFAPHPDAKRTFWNVESWTLA